MTVSHCQTVTALQGKGFARGATVEFVLRQLGMGEFPAHESAVPFDTGMRELGDL